MLSWTKRAILHRRLKSGNETVTKCHALKMKIHQYNYEKNNKIKDNDFTEFLLYTDPNGKGKVEIFLHNENIWLTQAKIAELFGVERSVVTKHLRNIFQEGELNKEATCAKIAQVQNEGERQVKRDVEFYNLDAIISVG